MIYYCRLANIGSKCFINDRITSFETHLTKVVFKYFIYTFTILSSNISNKYSVCNTFKLYKVVRKFDELFGNQRIKKFTKLVR